jgi:hypothetical protein
MVLPFKKRVDAIISDGLAPHLKRASFRKRGRTLRLAGEDHTRIVSVNASSREVPGQGVIGSYGVEIGVFFPEVYRIGDEKDAAEPRIHECYVYSGLPLTGWGFFDDLEDGRPSVEAQAEALGNAWLEYGEAWLDRYCDPAEALEWAKASEDWKEALYFAIHLNEMDEAAECLARCRIMWGGEWLDYLERVAAKHNVPGSGARSRINPS